MELILSKNNLIIIKYNLKKRNLPYYNFFFSIKYKKKIITFIITSFT